MDYGSDQILRGSGPDGVLYAIETSSGNETAIRDLRTTENKDPLGIASQFSTLAVIPVSRSVIYGSGRFGSRHPVYG